MTDIKPDEPKPEPKPEVLRVAAPFYVTEFVYGDYTVTNHGTEVPASRADRIINAAEKAGVTIEKVSK